ncbi:lipoprotein [Streptomyces capparidis]
MNGEHGSSPSGAGALRPAALRLAAFGLAAVCGACCLAGCSAGAAVNERRALSSDVVVEDPGAAVRRAARVLARAGTSKVRTTMRMVNGGTRVTIRGEGRFDYAARRGRLVVTLPGTAGAERGPITELVVPGALYMRNRGAEVPRGKWVRVETARLADGNLVTGGATDPVTAAELLRGARGVQLVGERVLDGVRVRRLRGTADMGRAARTAPRDTAGALRAALRSFTVTRVPFDACLDERGRLREVRQEFTFRSASSVGGAGNEVRVVSVTRLYDFGSEVDIELPRPGDIYAGRIVSPAARGRARS